MWDSRRMLRILIAGLALFLAGAGSALPYEIDLDNGQYFWNPYRGKPPVPLPLDKGKAAFDRAMDPGHAVLTGLGPAKDQTLTLDETTQEQFFALLGRVERIPDKHPDYPAFGYVSSLPGDSTVLLLIVEGWPASGQRVYEAELRSDGAGYEFAKSLHPSAAVNKDIATRSGLRLGMTKKEVKALLGWPLHEDKNGLWYGASFKHTFPLAEVLARGCDAKYAQDWALVYRNIDIQFTKGRASSILLFHRITWE